jgi:hypothetical protein
VKSGDRRPRKHEISTEAGEYAGPRLLRMAHGEAENLTGAGSYLLCGAPGGDAEWMLGVARDGPASLSSLEVIGAARR